MTALHGFYFDQHAVSYLTQFILILLVLFYLRRTAHSVDQIGPSLFFFITVAVYVGVELTIASAVWDRQFYALQLRSPAVYLGLLAIIYRTYTFPTIPDETFALSSSRERKIVVSLYALFCVAATGWAFYQWSQLKPGGHPTNNTHLLDLGVIIGMAWIFVVLLRRAKSLAMQNGVHRWGWRHLPGTQQHSAKALYQFIGISIFGIFLSGCMALTNLGVLPLWWRGVVLTAGVLLLIYLLAAFSFDAILKRSTFLGQIVGVTLLAVFMILGLTGIGIASFYSDEIDVRPAVLKAQTLQFVPGPSGYLVTSLPLQQQKDWGNHITASQVTLPFAFPFPCCIQTGQAVHSHAQIDLSRAGVIDFDDWSEPLFAYNFQPAIIAYLADPQPTNPLVEDTQVSNRVFVNAGGDQATITWPRMADGAEAVVQIVLYADGRFDIDIPQMSSKDVKRMGFQSGMGGSDFTPFDPGRVYENAPIARDGLLTDYSILYHQALHRLMLPLVGLVLIASLLSVVGYPVLFRVVLMRPLNALVQGVRRVEAGILDEEVPIFYNDEIGTITNSFNQMVNSVRGVEHRLATEVEERTQELAESQRQLGALEERERIGRDIHDDLGQVMGYVQMQVAAARSRMQQKRDDQALAILAEVDRVTLEAQDRVRQYILGIRTEGKQAQAQDFWSALDEYLAAAESRYDLAIELIADADLRADTKIAPTVETQLLRIIQEGLANVYKHAQATVVQLFFTADEENLTLFLKDNGRGLVIPVDEISTVDHFGLKIMRERAESVNGSFEISARPGEGTQLRVQVPRLQAPLADPDGASHPWRVMLVDDHALFREGLGHMLRPYGIQIVGMLNNGKEAEAQIEILQPDVILMDVNMPEQDGLETTRRIKARYPQIKIVMLTMADDEALLLQALKAGASGYLLKSLPAPHFLALLRDVMTGKTIIAPELAAQALTALARQDTPGLPDADDSLLATKLTDRQREVLLCVAEGLGNKAIGETLHISENTVKYHIKQILERLNLNTRHDLIRYYTYAANVPQSSPASKEEPKDYPKE